MCGRNALRTSGRSNATRTVAPAAPAPIARWYVTSVSDSNPGTTVQRDASKISDTMSDAMRAG